jgi:hypothetical protein
MPVVHRLLLSCNLDLSDFRINGVALHQLMPVEQGILEKTALPQLPSPNQGPYFGKAQLLGHYPREMKKPLYLLQGPFFGVDLSRNLAKE